MGYTGSVDLADLHRIRALHIYSEIYPYDITESEILAFAPKGIILSGGPETVTLETTPRAPKIVFSLGCPVLDICYGMQTMAEPFGGQVVSCANREFGYAPALVAAETELLSYIQDNPKKEKDALLDVWMSHGDHVEHLPPGFVIILNTPNTPIADMADTTRHFYGLQFQPEVTHTRQGKKYWLVLLKKFSNTNQAGQLLKF